MNALTDRFASDELLLRHPSDGRTLAQRLTQRYAARITGSFVVPGREGSYVRIPTKPATDSTLKPATLNALKPATCNDPTRPPAKRQPRARICQPNWPLAQAKLTAAGCRAANLRDRARPPSPAELARLDRCAEGERRLTSSGQERPVRVSIELPDSACSKRLTRTTHHHQQWPESSG